MPSWRCWTPLPGDSYAVEIPRKMANICEQDETGYIITGYGTLAASDDTSGVYEMKLALEYGAFPKVVYLQSAHKIALGDAPLEQ